MPAAKKSATKNKAEDKVEAKPTVIAKPAKRLREDQKKEEFRKYFVKLRRKINLAGDLQEVLWMHLKAVGCDNPVDFNRGIENFGYKL